MRCCQQTNNPDKLGIKTKENHGFLRELKAAIIILIITIIIRVLVEPGESY